MVLVKNIFKMHVKIINTIFIRIWNKLSGTKTIIKASVKPGSNACTSGNANQKSEVPSANLPHSRGCKRQNVI